MPKVKIEDQSEKNGRASPSSNVAGAIKEEDPTATMEPPSNDVLKQLIVKLVPQVDLNRTGVKQFTKRLAAELGGGTATLKNLQLRSEFIKETLSDVINAMEEDDDDEDDEPIIHAVAHKKKGGNSSKKTGKPKKPFKSNLATKAEMSEALSDFLGKGKMMARTEIVRELWDYIKNHKLQNPENKREIVLDDKMKAVFGVDTFTMFTMNKYIGAHVHPFKPVDLNTNTYIKRNKSGSGSTPTSAGKRKRDDGDGDGGDSDNDEKGDDSHDEGEERRPKKKRKKKAPGLQPPYRLSPALAAVVGKEVLPRPQVIAALWDYIKERDLQNPKDKREIFCDEKLKAVMDGNSKITMFNMNKMLTPHMLEKVDRSQYVHEEKKKNNREKDDHDEEEDEDGGEEEEKKAEDEESDDAKDKGSEHSYEEEDEEEEEDVDKKTPKKGKVKVKKEEAESDDESHENKNII